MASNAALNVLTWAAQTTPSDSQEVTWLKNIILGQLGRQNPFYDLIGGMNDFKPVMQVMDFSKTKGTDIVVTMDRPLGGPGVQGPGSTNSLVGNEETCLQATYRAQVGLFAHATTGDEMIHTQAVIGTDWDNRQRKKLKEYFAQKQANDIQFEMIDRAHSRNTIYPNDKTSRNQLTSADYLGLGTVNRVKDLLGANQAAPMSTRKTKSGEEVLGYLLIGSQYGFSGMAESNAFQNLLANAGERGDGNLLFQGGLPKYNGTWLHSWTVEDGTQVGPKAAPLCARAYLGIEMPANASDTDLSANPITAHASNTSSLFFQYFSNAAYIGHEGSKITADTTTRRYLAVKIIDSSHADVGKIALFSYTLNNGNRILGTSNTLKRLGSSAVGDVETTLTGSSIVYGTGAWTSSTVALGTVPVGSIIYEVNSKGQPFVKNFGLGRHAILAGFGAIGSGGAAVPGRRLEQKQDYGRVYGLGYEQVWGCRATENADNLVNGYVLVESAYNPPGWPTIE